MMPLSRNEKIDRVGFLVAVFIFVALPAASVITAIIVTLR